ncbi:tape measure protein [Gordonia phage Suzy]|uniref:Tape measure protein n=1 Tax=Gordonia phage Suzy TaxID=2201430 RepID=A0A2Z4Q7R0_9CAUD|nr:tail length tape measure protein [Gordonia phage Suzy]AWY06127.1 tape measure protein [Gordonia phage Suzy]
MSDYDLGRAHGEIEITTDVDSEGIARKLDRIRSSVGRLARQFRDAEDKLQRFERVADRIQRSTQRLASTGSKMIRTFAQMGSQVVSTTRQITGLDNALVDLRNTAQSVAKGIMSATMAMSEFSSVSGIAGAALHKFAGIGKELANFPKWAQDVVKLAGTIGTIGAVSGKAGAVARSRLVPAVRSAVGAMGAMSIAGVLLRDRVQGVAFGLGMAFPQIDTFAQKLKSAGRDMRGFGDNANKILQGTSKMILGMAAVRSGLRGLAGALSKVAPLMKYFAAGTLALGALGPIATVILGIVDAVKQLSGAALILPGALAVLVTAGGVAAVAISGLGQAFKAGFGEAEDFEKEIKDLSPRLVEFARSIQPLRKEFLDLRNSVTEAAFDGLIDSFKDIAESWLPLLESGMVHVAGGIDNITNSVLRFATARVTMESFAFVFANTRTVLDNVASGVEPVLRGFRTIGVIGTVAVVQLTRNLGALAFLFENWTTRVAADGSLEGWINDGVQGFRDLWHIMRDVSMATYELFQAFGGNGDGALEKTADGAKALRQAMEGLGNNDTFQKVVTHLEYASGKIVETFLEIGRVAGSAFVNIIPEMEALAAGFASKFIPIMKIAIQTLEVFINVIGALGLDTVIGQALGMAAALRLMLPVVMVLVNAFKLLAASMIFTGAQNALLGIATALDTFSRKAKVAETSVGKWTSRASNGFLTLAGLMTGPVLAAIATVVAAFMSIRAKNTFVDEWNSQLRKDAIEAKEAAEGIRDAFFENNGKFGKNVFDAVSASIDTMEAKIEGQANKGPGFMEWMGAAFEDVPTAFGDDYNKNTKQLQDMDHLQDRALRVREAIDEIGWSQEELTTAITGSTHEYNELVTALQGTEYGGGEAIEEFAAQRAEFEAIAQSMRELGPDTIQLANAMGVLADESSTAADKLSAITSALEAMGLLQVSEAEAFSRLRDSIKEVTTEASQLAEIDTGQLFNKDGSIDLASQAYGTFWETVRPISDNLRSIAAAGGDVGANLSRAWDEAAPALQAVQQELGLTDAQMQTLYRSTGLVPKELEMLVSVEGMDASYSELLRLSSEASKINGTPVEVQTTIQDSDTISMLQGIGAEVEVLNAKTGQVKVHFKDEGVWDDYLKLIARIEYDSGAKVGIELNPEDAKAVEDHINWLRSQGRVANTETPGAVEQGVPGQEPPPGRQQKPGQQPAPEPVQKPGAPPSTTDQLFKNLEPSSRKPGQPAPPPAPGQPAPPPEQVSPEQLPEKKQIDVIIGGGDHLGILARIAAAVQALPARKDVQVIIAGGDHLGILARITAAVNALPARKDVQVIIAGGDHLGILQRIVAAVQALPASRDIHVNLTGVPEIHASLGGVRQAIDGVVQAAEGFAAKMIDVANRSVAAINRVKDVINGVKTTMDTVARSAFASGQSLGQGFADGIKSKQAAVREASMALARSASEPLPRSPAKIGPFSGRGWTPFRGRSLAEGFAKGIHDGSDETQKASLDMVANIAKAMDGIRMAFGLTPTFFEENRTPGPGGKRYFRDPEVTDEELREAREKAAEKQAEKDEIAAEKAATKIPDAEKRIAEAQESVVEAQQRATEARTKANQKPGDQKAQDAAFRAEESLDKARERQTKAESTLRELQASAANAGTGTGAGGAAVEGSSDALVKSLDNAQYQMGGFSQAVLDCTGFVSALANARTGRPMFSERGNTTNLREFLLARGFKEGKGGQGDLSVGWWDNGGGANGHAAITTESGLNAESTTGGVRFGEGAAGARSNNSQFTDFMYLPGRGGGVAAVPIENKPAIDPASDQLTQDQVAQLIIAEGEAAGATEDEIKAALSTALVENNLSNKRGGPDSSTGAFQQQNFGEWTKDGRNRDNVSDASRTFYEQLLQTRGKGTPGQRAQMVQRSAYPDKYDQRMAEASMFYTRNKGAAESFGSASGMAATAGNTEDTVALLRQNNKTLDQAITTAQDPNASEGDVIRALQDIDDAMVGMSATERQSMDSIREAVMTDRGIKEYDPFEDAPETPKEWFDTIFTGIIANVVGLIQTIEGGINAAVDMAHLVSRGFANTNDVHTFVDGIQGLVGTAVEIASTIGSVIQSVASIAAVAGAAIPGIGQVGAVISAVSGGIADVNAVVDLMQDVTKIGGRLFGGALSSLLGLGGTGQLEGQIRTLMDLNDKTIKTWSDRNAADKSVMGLPGSQVRDPNQASNFRDLNIYQGPGQDPAEMMNNAMFAVAAHSQGVYGG